MKKQNVLQAFSTVVLTVVAYFVITGSAMAHPGHDHTANESMLMHVLFYGSIAVAIAACTWFAYRQFTKHKDKQKVK